MKTQMVEEKKRTNSLHLDKATRAMNSSRIVVRFDCAVAGTVECLPVTLKLNRVGPSQQNCAEVGLRIEPTVHFRRKQSV